MIDAPVDHLARQVGTLATDLADAPLKIAGNLRTAGLSDVRIFRRWVGDEEARLLARDHLLKQRLQHRTQTNKQKQGSKK